MNSSIPSRFALNDSLRTIFNELMIEEWTIEGFFDNYYDSCAPSTCTYTYAQRLDIVYVVTTIVSLFGGLVVVLRLLSPISVRIVHATIRLWQRRLQRAINLSISAPTEGKIIGACRSLVEFDKFFECLCSWRSSFSEGQDTNSTLLIGTPELIGSLADKSRNVVMTMNLFRKESSISRAANAE